MITAICQECGKQFDYELKPGFPRKYCPECSAVKKQAFADKQPIEVVKVGAGREDNVKRAYEAGTQENKPKVFPKDPVGLAVEIFLGLLGNDVAFTKAANVELRMKTSIELVKQAQEAFS